MSFQQGLSGLNTAAKQLDVIGNNVANAGTVGFKQSQAQFADMYAASLAGGGGLQVGTGVKLAAVAQQFTQGNVTNTNNAMDTAISGAGFFQMIDQSGAILYSRNGQFQVDKSGFIVNNIGHQVQGYQATAGVVTAVQGSIRIDPAPLPPKQTSDLAGGGAPVGVGANLDSRTAFPLGITQGTITGNAVAGLSLIVGGSRATTAAVLTDYSAVANNVSFNVDGNPVTLDANYGTAAAVASAIGTQLGANYTVTQAAGAVTITSNAAAAAPVITGFAGLPANDVFTAGAATHAGGSRTTTAAVATDYSGANNVSFTVDGNAVSLNANYGTTAATAAAIGAQLGANYTVTQTAAGVVTIVSTASTTAPVVANYAGVPADVFTAGAAAIGAPANQLTVTVDGVTSGTVTIPAASYTTTAALAGAVQAAINADATLLGPPVRSVVVSVGASGNLVIASSSGGAASSIALTDVVAGTVANLFGTAAPVAGAGTFNPNTPDSYNNSTSLTIYDSQGTQHIASLYFQKATTNAWNVYLTVDNTAVPATATPLATMNFSTAGTLVDVTPGATSTQGSTLKMVTSTPYAPVGANPMSLAFDFSQTTQYGGAFGVNSLTQDGYTSGELSGFSTGTDGTIVGRYTNGQTQSLGQIGLVNFTNPQGLQPVGNNEWVETPQSGVIPLNRPGSSGLGLLQSSAIEDSNVDLTAELVNMITAQRVYQANAQTIKTQDAVLQTLVNLR